MGRKPKPQNCCVDCGKYALHGEDYFMARDPLWKKAGVGRGVLCLNCFEKRLARKLKAKDFNNAPVNMKNPIIKKIMEGRA